MDSVIVNVKSVKSFLVCYTAFVTLLHDCCNKSILFVSGKRKKNGRNGRKIEERSHFLISNVRFSNKKVIFAKYWLHLGNMKKVSLRSVCTIFTHCSILYAEHYDRVRDTGEEEPLTKEVKYYPQMVSITPVSFAQIIKRMEKRSTVSSVNVKAVLDALHTSFIGAHRTQYYAPLRPRLISSEH